MSLVNVPRRLHQQRAERHRARFSPTWDGGVQPTSAVLAPAPAAAAPPGQAKHDPPVAQPAPAPDPATPQPAPVAPAPVANPPAPVPTVPAVVTPVASATPTLDSVVPVTTSPSVPVEPTPFDDPTTASQTVPDVVTLSSYSDPSFLSETASPSTTAVSSHTSSGMSTAAIVGIAAGGIAGVVLIGAFGVWVLKRWFQDRDADDDDHGEFNRRTWMRNSVAIDDNVPVRGLPGESPRPPTMIERRQNGFSNLAPSRSQPPMPYPDYQDASYGGLPPVPSFGPGQQSGGPYPNLTHPFSPIAPAPPSPGMASIDETMPPMQHAANPPVYFSRHDSGMSNMSAAHPESATYTEIPNPYNSKNGDGYATLDRSSVTPYQAEQYAAISRHLTKPLPPVSEGEPGSGPSPFADTAAAPHQGHESNASIEQLTNAFPAAPMSPSQSAFPPPSPRTVALPASPMSFTFPPAKAHAPSPMNPAHAGEAPGQAETVPANSASSSSEPAAQAAAPPSRPDTVYNEEDAYGGI